MTDSLSESKKYFARCPHCLRLVQTEYDYPQECPYLECGYDGEFEFEESCESFEPLRFTLRVKTPKGLQSHSLENDEYIIGSGDKANIQIPSAQIAPRHARLFIQDDEWHIQPLAEYGKVIRVALGDNEVKSVAKLTAGEIIWLGRVPAQFAAIPKLAPKSADVAAEKRIPILLDKPLILIGSDSVCDIHLPGLMPVHAEISQENGRWVLEDKASVGDVKINRTTALKTEIQSNDRVSIGPFHYIKKDDGLYPDGGSEGFSLETRGLTFTIPFGPKLLDDFSFEINSNEFVGIVGPSGSGKSTLLKLLAGYLKPDENGISPILIDARPSDSLDDEFRSMIGYVPQDDVLHQVLPVEKALGYYADLRLKGNREAKNERVNAVIDQVQLHTRRKNIISRLSGGQRKRVNVAAELVSKPRILFMDEPTSGLDPGTETDLMHQLRAMANADQTIVCTTHVMENAELFDKILVIRPDGEGGAAKLDFFGSPSELRRHYNIQRMVDLYRRIDPNLSTTMPQEPKEKVSSINDQFKKFFWSFFAWPFYPLKYLGHFAGLVTGNARTLWTNPSRLHKGVLSQGLVLTRRYANVLFRDRQFLFLLILLQPILLGLMIALCVPVDFRETSRDLLLFLGSVACIWLGLNGSIREIVREKDILRRERQVGLKLVSYLGSKVLVLGLVGLLQCAMISTILASRPELDREDFRQQVLKGGEFDEIVEASDVYWFRAYTFGLPSPANFKPKMMAQNLLGFWLCFLAAMAIGLAASAAVKTEEAAVALLPIITIPQILFSRIIAGFGKTSNFAENWIGLPGFKDLIECFERGDVFSVLSSIIARLMPSHYGFEMLRAFESGSGGAIPFIIGLLAILVIGLLAALSNLRLKEIA